MVKTTGDPRTLLRNLDHPIWENLIEEIHQLVNDERKTRGLPPYPFRGRNMSEICVPCLEEGKGRVIAHYQGYMDHSGKKFPPMCFAHRNLKNAKPTEVSCPTEVKSVSTTEPQTKLPVPAGKKLCLCGCGTEVSPNTSCDYFHGHKNRGLNGYDPQIHGNGHKTNQVHAERTSGNGMGPKHHVKLALEETEKRISVLQMELKELEGIKQALQRTVAMFV